jgi:hypothetical protein
VQGSTAVILLNFSAKNPPHRQAVNRFGQVKNPERSARAKGLTTQSDKKNIIEL